MGLFSLVLSGVSFLLFIVCSLSYTLEYKFFASETNWGYVNQRSTEWNKNELHEEDVLFFGSSTCYSGIDPSALNAFGLSGFNFCSSSQAIGNSASLIPAASMDVSPECIALDVYPWIWGTTTPALESTKDWIINSNLRTPTGQRRIGHWLLNPATSSPFSQHSITISCADSKRPEAIPSRKRL